MAATQIKLDVKDGVGIIRLDTPDSKVNTLSKDMQVRITKVVCFCRNRSSSVTTYFHYTGKLFARVPRNSIE